MKAAPLYHLRAREKALANAMREFASELRLIDAIELVAIIRAEQFAHIESLVNSASELCFKHGAVSFGSCADLHLDWGTAPTIWLDMEFANWDIRVYFSLVLESCQAGVEINYVSFGDSNADDAANTQRLIDAIDDATMRRPESFRADPPRP